jgi:hypothetical protein
MKKSIQIVAKKIIVYTIDLRFMAFTGHSGEAGFKILAPGLLRGPSNLCLIFHIQIEGILMIEDMLKSDHDR